MKRTVSGIMLILFLLSPLGLVFVYPVKASSGTIYIRAGGSINPPTANITTSDYVTYVFTDNNYDSIVVERSNIIIDGAGYILQGAGSGTGFDCSNIKNVTLKNVNIQEFGSGIMVYESSCIVISGNNIMDSTQNGGVWIGSSSYNTVFGNNITNPGYRYGITLINPSTSNNIICGNNITNNAFGVIIDNYASSNSIIENNITDNDYGVYLHSSSNNKIYHNNIVSNINQAYSEDSVPDIWDYGYPSGGNYWSDYNGTDANHDGIGDTPYIIDSSNQDNYPLIHPYGSICNLNTGLTYLTIQSAIDAPETLNGHTIYVKAGTYFENLVVNKTLTIAGEGSNATIIKARKAGGTTADIVANGVTIAGFTVINEYVGSYNPSIFVDRVQGCVISDNIIKSAEHAIWLVGSNKITIRKNTIINGSFGVRLFSSNQNTITENTIFRNWVGVSLEDSLDNIIFHNNFINNTKQVLTDNSYATAWDEGYPSGGNYWSDYVGVDVKGGSSQDLPGSDGIGDTPYTIDANNMDHYPLMSPFGATPLPTYTLTIMATGGGTTTPALGAFSYMVNSQVQVTSIPNAGYLFSHWELDSVNVGSANPYTVLMDKSHALKAVFVFVAPPPLVGGIALRARTLAANPAAFYIGAIAILAVVFTAIKHKRKRNPKE